MEVLAGGDRSERTIVFVLYSGITLLDLVGPLEVLNRLPPPFKTEVIGETIEPVGTSLPVQVIPDATFEDVPNPFAVIVPGGSEGSIRAMGDERLRKYLLSAERTADVVGSVCTGALILAAAGLLNGREATTHWSYAMFLNRLGARYVKKRWVRDGKFITSAGVSAGIDMALELASQFAGAEVARRIQIGLEYDPQPPLGDIDWSEVDLEARTPWILSKMKSELAHRPDLLKLLDEGH